MKKLMTCIVTFIVVFSLISTVNATPISIVLEENGARPTPIVFGNHTPPPPSDLIPIDICVSETGITFTVNFDLGGGFGEDLPCSLISWNENGSIRWSVASTPSDTPLFGVATDGTYVYATGNCGDAPFLVKYDYQGIKIWNTTWNSGEGARGLRIAIADDGTIVVAGGFYNYALDCFLIAFDTEGQELWHKMYQETPSFSCNANFIYIVGNGTLQKCRTDGSLVWSTNITEESQICARGNSVYSLNISLHFQGIPDPGYYLDLARWDAMTGEQLWKHDIRICDTNQQEYNCTRIEFAIDQSGSLVLLMQIIELESWYLSRIASNGTILSTTNLLDNSWSSALVKVEESGVIHIAGSGPSFGLGVALFDSSLIPVPIPTSFELVFIAIVVIGVIGLILYLKKKHTS